MSSTLKEKNICRKRPQKQSKSETIVLSFFYRINFNTFYQKRFIRFAYCTGLPLYKVCNCTVQLVLASQQAARYLNFTVQLVLAGQEAARYLNCTVQLVLACQQAARYLNCTVQLVLACQQAARYLNCTVQLVQFCQQATRYLNCTVQLVLAGQQSALNLNLKIFRLGGIQQIFYSSQMLMSQTQNNARQILRKYIFKKQYLFR